MGRMKTVKGRMKEAFLIWLCQQGFACPVEREILTLQMNVPVSRRCQSVQLFIHYAHAIGLQTTTGNGIWAKLRLGTGIWYTPPSGPCYNIVVVSYKYPNCGSDSSLA